MNDGALTAQWAPILAFAPAWEPPLTRTIVVVPHPDDETLSTGGVIAHQVRSGVEVLVVAVTDGGAAYGPSNDRALEAVRRGEQLDALEVLGVRGESVRRLGLPDGRVAEHRKRLVAEVRAIICPGDLVIAPWTNDHHSDHIAVGDACVEAAEHVAVTLMFGLFWAWHHTSPATLAALPLVGLELDEEEIGRKQRALLCHRSQTTHDLAADPILDTALTEPATWPDEYFIMHSTH